MGSVPAYLDAWGAGLTALGGPVEVMQMIPPIHGRRLHHHAGLLGFWYLRQGLRALEYVTGQIPVVHEHKIVISEG
jgi:hypothetical protein